MPFHPVAQKKIPFTRRSSRATKLRTPCSGSQGFRRETTGSLIWRCFSRLLSFLGPGTTTGQSLTRLFGRTPTPDPQTSLGQHELPGGSHGAKVARSLTIRRWAENQPRVEENDVCIPRAGPDDPTIVTGCTYVMTRWRRTHKAWPLSRRTTHSCAVEIIRALDHNSYRRTQVQRSQIKNRNQTREKKTLILHAPAKVFEEADLTSSEGTYLANR